jgi:very-short-patch-repair endonuclease
MDEQMRERARLLRLGMSEAERLLWYHLRAGRLRGSKFRRQKPLGCYIVDFVCVELGLIVEVDGGQHLEQREYDERRTRWLEGQGFSVLRFWNHEVLQQTEAVLEQIVRWVEQKQPSPHPLSRKRARG